METITLSDGTVVNGHCFSDDRNLYVYLDGMTVIEGVLLCTPERMTRIVANNHGNEHVYEGYTEIWSANHEFGNCNLILRRREDA